MADVNNPWLEEFWSLTAQGAYIKKYGLSVAQRTARKARSFVGALKPAFDPNLRTIERQWILSRKISTGGSSSGSAGDGPPS
jgi:hypothetical protein